MTRPLLALVLCLLTSSTALAAAPTAVAADADELLQLVDYVAVDYPNAVRDGQVVSAAEFAEMTEFSRRAAALAAAQSGSPRDPEIAALGATLAAQVAALADVAALRRTATVLRSALIDGHALASAPRAPPDLAAAKRLFLRDCASCHGASGRGDGPTAASLDPHPTDFGDAERARQRSLLSLHSTISRGVEGTAMRAFSELKDDQRWALAWYVGTLHLDPADVSAGRAALADHAPAVTLAAFASRSPAELFADGLGAPLVAALRADPAPLFSAPVDPLAIARARLADSRSALAAGDRAGAYRAALAAYLDGFEIAEPTLRAVVPERVAEVEGEMLALREALQHEAQGDDGVALAARYATLDASLTELGARLASHGTMDPSMGFASSFFILLREGLEAMLLVGLIITVLVKTGHREGLRAVHQGWVLALLLGIATWAVSSWLIGISGATREMTEGVAALLAAVVLLYVGFWMHDKLSAERWHHFITSQVEQALAGGSRWTLGMLAFIAVYREVFEIVLFYQALWVQADSHTVRSAILLGAVAAAFALAALTWAIFKLGMRLPLRQFFGVSAALMIVLAVVFAGKGVAALQEAGRVPLDSLPLPTVELLGIYPTVQSLGLQLAFVAMSIALVLYNRRAEQRAG